MNVIRSTIRALRFPAFAPFRGHITPYRTFDRHIPRGNAHQSAFAEAGTRARSCTRERGETRGNLDPEQDRGYSYERTAAGAALEERPERRGSRGRCRRSKRNGREREGKQDPRADGRAIKNGDEPPSIIVERRSFSLSRRPYLLPSRSSLTLRAARKNTVQDPLFRAAPVMSSSC